MLPAASEFDLIVIGGGINGAAIAREAALSGISVLLLEQEDLCSGTSAASTRLIHGGLRYLEHAEFGLVHESLQERERLLTLASHLVQPLRIVIPITRGSRRGRVAIRLGMMLYGLLSMGKSVPRYSSLSQPGLHEEMPGLKADGLLGGVAYYDAQVAYPERLVLENALDARANGAVLALHTRVTELLVADGRVNGVRWQSGASSGVARARVVVNAAGPWVDRVLGNWSSRRLIGGTRGSHLVAEPFVDAPEHAVYAEAHSDGRPFFIIPWNGLYLIGTTDEHDSGDPGETRISETEYTYLITEAQRLFPAAIDLPERVRYCQAGIRPLPQSNSASAGAITRRHLIEAQPGVAGLFSIVGGKLTTHRALAEDCLQRVRKELGLPRQSSPTRQRPLPGHVPGADRDRLVAQLADQFGAATAARLFTTYGKAAAGILRLAQSSVELNQRIGPDCQMLVAEITHAFEHEAAGSLSDCLLRRSMIGLGPDLGRHAAPLVADWLVRLGLRDKRAAAAELSAYAQALRRFAVPGQERSTASKRSVGLSPRLE